MNKLSIWSASLSLALSSAFAQAPAISTDGANYSLNWEDQFAVTDSTFAVKIDGQWLHAGDFAEHNWTENAGIYTLTAKGLGPIESMKLRIETELGRPYVVLRGSLQAKMDFKLEGLRLLTREGEGINISLGQDAPAWNTFLEHLHGPKTGRIVWVPNMHTLKKTKREDLRDGFWLSTMQNDGENKLFALAALEGEFWPTILEWRNFQKDAVHVSVRSSSPEGLEKVLVRAGTSITVDPVLVGFWNDRRPTQALDEVGRIMGESVRKGRPMRMVEPGWSTWHSYGRTITADAMLAAARTMKTDLYDAGYRYIQLDGGWWTKPGSYYVNEDFPRGIRDVANQITDMGLKFGLHISPLRVNPTDPYWKQHPDWLLSPYNMDPIDPQDEEMMTTLGMVYLDGSHPSVPPYLAGQFKQLVEDYRPTYMKWDHHYGSVEEGDRYDPTMTGLQSHNKAVRMIRAALPEDLVVTRSMGWLYGAIECYDAIRVGNDINHMGVTSEAEPYANMTYGKTSGTIDQVLEGNDYKGIIRFARSIAQNYYVHRHIAISDPDSFLTTPQITLEEARIHVTLQALMGGFLFGGDRIESLPKDRLDLYKHQPVLDVWAHHEHAVPLDLFTGVDIPRIWKLELVDRIVFGLFNWMDEASETTWSLEDLELPAGDYQIKDIWSGETVPMGKTGLTLAMEAHTVRLIEFKK